MANMCFFVVPNYLTELLYNVGGLYKSAVHYYGGWHDGRHAQANLHNVGRLMPVATHNRRCLLLHQLHLRQDDFVATTARN